MDFIIDGGIKMAADTLTLMQNGVSELHRVFITVADYIKKKQPAAAMGSLEIDYSNPDQEFYLRIFTEFEQLATMLAHGLNYIDRPVRKQGTLSFDFSEGKYKLDDEYLTNGQLFEFMENNQWHIGKLQNKPGSIEYIILDAIKNTPHNIEPKGLTVRLR